MASIQTGIELNDQFSNVIYGIINSVNLAVSGFEEMQSAMNANVDTSGFENVREEINRATMAMDEFSSSLNSSSRSPVEIPITWNTGNIADVFTSSGIARFRQEAQSANSMLERLNATQDAIARRASNINILPPQAAQDLDSLAARVDLVRERIGQISSNPMNVGTDEANQGLEELRSQLAAALEAQEDMNRAIENMDVQSANDAYARLSQTIGNTERYIRDNVDEQGRFDSAIEEGNAQADRLAKTIMGAASAYLSIQGIGKTLGISDELVSTTARLAQMNDGLQTTQELTNMVYAAAQDARGSFSEMADVVARFGNNARDAFSSSGEVVAFSGLVQKQMAIAGASTQEASNAMLQLSQALGSGVLRGDELNSIFEQAPNLIQSIADYLDVPIGQIRAMAQEGELTADIVKSAIFASADDINAKFAEMPMTWGQAWQRMRNAALIAFQPVLQRINEIANSEAFQDFANGAIEAMAVLAGVLLDIFDLVGQVGQAIADNWSWISPIIYGVIGALATYAAYLGIVKGIELASAAASAVMAAGKGLLAAATMIATGATWAETTAQMGLNSAMYACPIVWIIMLVIALIAALYAIVGAINEITGSAISATGIIIGAVAVLGAYILNAIGLVWNIVAAFIEFLVNVWKNPEYAIKAFVVNVATAYLKFCLSCVTGTQSAVGVIVGLWRGFQQAVHNVAAAVYNAFMACVEAVVNGWNSGVYQVKSFLVGIATAALDVAQSVASSMGSAASAIANAFISAANTAIRAINSIIGALNNIPGVNIGTVSEIGKVSWDFGASAIADTSASLQSLLGDAPSTWTAPRMEFGSIGDAYDAGKQEGADLVSSIESTLAGTTGDLEASIADKPEGYWEAPKFDYINLSDAAMAGYGFGEGLENKVGNFDPASLFGTTDIPSPEDYASEMARGGGLGDIGSGVDDIAGNTGSIADSMDITEEDLKYLRDIAEQETVNRFTTAEIRIEQNNTNNISSSMDLDGVVNGLTDAVGEAVEIIAGGVHW